MLGNAVYSQHPLDYHTHLSLLTLQEWVVLRSQSSTGRARNCNACLSILYDYKFINYRQLAKSGPFSDKDRLLKPPNALATVLHVAMLNVYHVCDELHVQTTECTNINDLHEMQCG